MKINYIDQRSNHKNNNTLQSKIAENHHCVTFTGLNKTISKTIYPSGKLLESIHGIYKSSIVGNIPNEFINLIKKNTNICKTEIRQNIKTVYEAFGQAGRELDKINQLNKNAFKQLLKKDDKKILEEYFKVLRDSEKSLDPEIISSIHESFRKVEWISTETRKLIEDNATHTLESALKNSGVLKKDDSLKLNFIGEGLFGRCYQISATSIAGKQIFTDKVLKIYKNSSIESDFLLNSFIAKLQINKKYEKEINIYIDKRIKEKPYLKYFFGKLRPKNIIGGDPEEMQKNVTKFFIESLMAQFKDFHGVYAEANNSAYVSKFLGHDLSNSDITKQHFFDFKNNIGLSEFADEYITRKNNLSDIGVKCLDRKKSGNTVKGKLVDMGGFNIEDKNLISNPIVRKINKKIKHTSKLDEKIKLWNKYYNQAKENKIANSIDVIKGLSKALENIPTNCLNKLDISFSEIKKLRPDIYRKIYSDSFNNITL